MIGISIPIKVNGALVLTPNVQVYSLTPIDAAS